jgi:hypothetical chaperone protein
VKDATIFSFQVPGISISHLVTRKHFEEWIEEELQQISACVGRLLTKAGADNRDVNKIFLTGGSSFVPAVRRIFAQRFNEDRLVAGDEFSSVARGLALRALDLSSH